MNIAIIEKGHFEVAYTLVSLFDNSDNQITIFIDESSYGQLSYLLHDKASQYTWIIQRKESNRVFVKQLFNHIQSNSFDLIYFDTIADNFIHYARHIRRLNKEKVIMTLHDINGFFHYTPSLSIRKLVRYAGKKKLISLISGFNVLSETLVPHLQKKLTGQKKIFNIPGSFFEPENFTRKEYKKNEIIRITVPGSIDIRRRDYSQAFELLNKAGLHGINISVTLLGGFTKNYSGQIHEESMHYLKTNNNLHIYETEIVNQAEFDKVMDETHFIWMPFQSSAIVTDGAVEQYGVSISSGNIGDVIRYARPFFAPNYFNADRALQKSCCQYNDISGIVNTLKKLDKAEYEFLQNEAFNASMNYIKSKIIVRNQSLFH